MTARPGRIAAWGALLVLLAVVAQAEETERRVVVVTRNYEACAAHRWLLGENWRTQWSAPIEVEVLDLANTAGGLRPAKRVGGLQTHGLAFEGADGRSYTFRSVQKRGDGWLPASLRFGPLGALLRDQASANLPGANLVAATLSRRLGLAVTPRRIVVLPDDPALGPHRDEFAGLTGTLSEYPQPGPDGSPGTFGYTETLTSEELWTASRTGDAANVDARAYLRARLVDWWIGDWDRHPGQWRWGLADPEDGYQPLPEDHDHAFTHFDGVLVLALVRPVLPWVGPYDDAPSLRGMTNNSWWLDAWILAGLDRDAWIEEIDAFEAGVDASVVDDAIAELPRGWRELGGDALRRELEARAAALRRLALEIQASISRIAHLYGSDAADRVEVDCRAGAVDVTLVKAGRATSHRSFLPKRTERIELHLLSGDDRVIYARGSARCEIPLRERESVRLWRGIPAPVDRVRDPRRPGRSRSEPRF